MNKLFVIALLAGLSTSCGTVKNTSSPTASSGKPPVATATPVFLENISIPGERNTPKVSSGTPTMVKAVSNVVTPGELTFPLQFKYSILLDVPVEEIRDEKLFNFIEEWYGTRYLYGGNGKDGIDCSAFTQSFIYNLYGIMVPRTSIDQYINSKRVKKQLLQQGDLVFFRTTSKSVSHVGIYLFNNKFLHSSTSYGVTISDLDDAYYSQRYAGGGRVKKEF